MRYIFPVNYIKQGIESKLVIPYYQRDKDYKILAMFQQIILDADDDVECGTHTLHQHQHSHQNHIDKRHESETEKLISCPQKCCNRDH